MEPAVERDVALIEKVTAVPKILEVVAQITGMRFAAVARVTDKSWTACAVYDRLDFGLAPGGELALESTICNEVRQHEQPVIFGHASKHPIFATHHTPKQYGLESYVSIPIFRSSGEFFGTLCAIDPKPMELDESKVVRSLELFAELISAQMDVEERLEQSTTDLLDAQETASLREQFIAVIGHDLRSPLSSIQLGTQLLKQTSDPKLEPTFDRILRSCRRMGSMIENVLDFARGRLGGGIPLAVEDEGDLASELGQVIDEVRAAHPGRVIDAELAIPGLVRCDHRRLGQLLSNLLVNAMTYGATDQPVRVTARADGARFELSVHNAGPAIPDSKRQRLFKPFSRTAANAPEPGLGLGLYIAAEIARAHDGTLDVTSTDAAGTTFVFRMPI